MKLTSIILALAASALAIGPQRRDTATAAAAAATTTDPSGFNFGQISSALYEQIPSSLILAIKIPPDKSTKQIY